MKYCLYYWIFAPLRGGISDAPDKVPEVKLTIKYKGVDYELRLYCDENKAPEFARIRINDLEDEEIPPNALELIQVAKEHLLSTLKLGYREDIQIFPISSWCYFDISKEESFDLSAKYQQHYVFDAESINGFFIHSMVLREEIRLLVDAIDEKIPLQYRFLSLYKFFEIKYKSDNFWKKNELEACLNRYQSQFDNIGILEKPYNLLHDLRDKCAHIRTGNKANSFGVTHLNHKQAVRVAAVIPIFRDICRDLINIEASGLFVLGELGGKNELYRFQ